MEHIMEEAAVIGFSKELFEKNGPKKRLNDTSSSFVRLRNGWEEEQ